MVSLDPLEAGSLSETVAAINELITALRRDPGIINLDKIHYATGIPTDVISSILAGNKVDLDSMSPPLAERLQFLQKTRLKETPAGATKYTNVEIAKGTGVTKTTVGNVLNGKKGASNDVTVALAGFFGVEVGYFLDPWSKVLNDALKPEYQALKDLALLRRVGIKTIRFRGNPHLDDKLGQEVRAALREAIEDSESKERRPDPAIQELTDDLESLPDSRRKKVIPAIAALLGLAKPDEADAPR
ncbi:helix-turn-helix domain-containing protein [Streptomyces cinereoruber]